MNWLPTDVVQKIGLATQSTETYLNLALCCKRFSKLLQKPRRERVLQHFTKIAIQGSINTYDDNDDSDDEYDSVDYSIDSIDDVKEWRNKEWRINGKRHREDGPAIEGSNGNKAWYLNGKLHREDGPAIEYHDGKNRPLLPKKDYQKLTVLSRKKHKL